jgi:hypothetical protein
MAEVAKSSDTKSASPAAPPRPALPEPEKFPDSDPGRPWPDKASAQAAKDAGQLAKPLAIDRCRLLEHEDPGFWVCLEAGTPYEEVFKPAFWANVIREKQFKVGQTIRLRNDEMSVFAELVVLEVGDAKNWAIVGEYSKRTIDELVKSRPPQKTQPRHVIRHRGPVEKFSVVREDGQVIRSRFETEAAAQGFLADHLRRMIG